MADPVLKFSARPKGQSASAAPEGSRGAAPALAGGLRKYRRFLLLGCCRWRAAIAG